MGELIASFDVRKKTMSADECSGLNTETTKAFRFLDCLFSLRVVLVGCCQCQQD
jgi:hypothetical protein